MVKFIFLVMMILFYFDNVTAQEENTEIDPYAGLAELIAAEEGPFEKCKDYIKEKGWKEFIKNDVNGKEVRMACGRSGIGVAPSKKDFLSSRTVAFNDALLNAQKRFSEFKSKEIQVQIVKQLQKGFGLDEKSAIEKNNDIIQADEETQSDNLFKKLYKLANNEVDERLEDVDTKKAENTQKIQEEIDNLAQSSVFEKTIQSASQITMNGLQSFKIWEECKEGKKQCKVSILALRTLEQGNIAKALLNKNSINLKGKPGSPLITDFTPKQVMANIGVRIKRDENGNYHLLSTATSTIETDSELSEDIAIKEAIEEADSNLRLFAGAQISANSETVLKEIFEEFKSGKQENEVQKKINASTKAFSEKASIEGITELDSGITMHPANKVKARFVVRKWSLNSQADASGADFSSGSNNQNENTDISNEPPVQEDLFLESEEADF
ncbi:MAG: hypothetical protein CMP40_00785 [Rickettsiales bacterium]|nr:hypothetical protein [Rickettsiales bacterium]